MLKAIYKKLISEKHRITIRRRFSRIRTIGYLGNNVTCNCCNLTFRKFLSKGHHRKRENAECPYCGSLERTRVIKFYLEREVFSHKTPHRVLHFAPEKCLETLFKGQQFEYIDADINPAYAHNQIDITQIPFPENYFDLIICSHVLGHVLDEKKAISELYRVLQPGGQAIVLSLLMPDRGKTLEMPELETSEEKLLFYGEPDLFRRHGRDFITRLQQEEWKVDCIDYSKHLPPNFQTKYQLGNGERELIYSCFK